MIWFLALHIVALLFWCAALLYLPALIIMSHGKAQPLAAPPEQSSMPRFIFTHISGPAAVVAIMAGTMVFLLDRTVESWLLAKLSVVTLLTIFHVLTGLLVLRIEEEPEKPVLSWCWSLELTFLALMAVIIWLVLAKPESWGTPW